MRGLRGLVAAAALIGSFVAARDARADWCANGGGGTQCYPTLDQCNSVLAMCQDAAAHGATAVCPASCEPTGADAQPPPPPPGGGEGGGSEGGTGGGVGSGGGGTSSKPWFTRDRLEHEGWPFGRSAVVLGVGLGPSYNFGSNDGLSSVVPDAMSGIRAIGVFDLAVRVLKNLQVGGFFLSSFPTEKNFAGLDRPTAKAYGGLLRFPFVADADQGVLFEFFGEIGFGKLNFDERVNHASGSGGVYSLRLGFDALWTGGGVGFSTRLIRSSVDKLESDSGPLLDTAGQQIKISFTEWEFLEFRVNVGL